MAPRVAEHPDVLLPVLVCLDGFTITHSAEVVELLPDDWVRRFVGEYEIPHAVLDVAAPVSHGPFAMPDTYMEFRLQQARALERALDVFKHVAGEFRELSGREYSSLEAYHVDGARQALVALGSTAGTIKDAVDGLDYAGLVKLTAFRPFPAADLRRALEDVEQVIVLDRADSPGGAPPLHAEVAAALYGSGIDLVGHVYGLGGRDFHPEDALAWLA